MPILNSIEYTLGRLLYRSKGYDDALLINQPASRSASGTIEVTSPEIGASGSDFKIEHTAFSSDASKRNLFPRLSWRVPPNLEGQIKEFVLCVEDADAPVHPKLLRATHGLYYSIPASKRQIGPEDLELRNPHPTKTPGKGAKAPVLLQGGFRLGKNVIGSVYGGPRPVLGHGPHRYFYQVIALKEPLDVEKMSPVATLKEVTRECEGKICGLGSWTGVWENK